MLSSQVCLRPTHVMSGVGTLEAEALKRKARLAALRNQQGDDNAEDTQLHKEEVVLHISSGFQVGQL